MAVLLTGSEDLAVRHEFAIGEDLKIYSNRRELIRAVEDDAGEDIIIVGSDVELSIAAQLAEHFRSKRPSLSVILIRNRVDAQTLNEAIKAGLRDVVSVEDATALVDAVRRSKVMASQLRVASGTQLQSQHRSAIVVVFSAKGGCGKTTTATNLAIAFGNLGLRTCVVDFDLQFGDIAVALQLPTSRTISDALSMELSLDRLGVTGLTVPINDKVDALLAPLNPSDAELISGDLGEKILIGLQEEYDIVVVDSPPAFTEVMVRSFDLADMTLLLTTLDTPAIKNLVSSIRTLDALGLQNKRRRVIVNRSDSRAGLDISDVEAAIDMSVSGQLKSSVDVPASTNQGVALISWKPRHRFSQDIQKLASTVCDDLGLQPKIEKRGFRWKK